MKIIDVEIIVAQVINVDVIVLEKVVVGIIVVVFIVMAVSIMEIIVVEMTVVEKVVWDGYCGYLVSNIPHGDRWFERTTRPCPQSGRNTCLHLPRLAYDCVAQLIGTGGSREPPVPARNLAATITRRPGLLVTAWVPKPRYLSPGT